MSTSTDNSCQVTDVKTIHIGLMADPGSPTAIARQMSDLRSPGGEARDDWRIEVVSEPFTTDPFIQRLLRPPAAS